jgi:PhnB protein
MAKTKPIPEGYHNVTPYLVVKGAAAAIDFYKQVFGAIEIMRMPQSDGRVGHAELKFGNSVVMLADEFPEMEVVGPKTLGNSPVGLLLYVDDVDKTVERAVSKGATIKKPTSFTVIEPARLKIPGDINGPSRCIWKMSRRKKCSAAWRPRQKSKK